MSDETTIGPRVLTSIEDVEAAVDEIAELLEDIREIDDERAAALLPFDEARTAKQAAIDNLYESIAIYVMRRRKSWLQRLGRTATVGKAVIKFRIIPKSVMMPKDEKPVIALLMLTPAGRKLIRFKPEVDKDAVKNASQHFLRVLKRLGVHVGEQETLSILVDGQAKPVVVRKYRFPRR